MPKLDCGLCGNPSCRTMARKIATGDAKPEQCVNLSTRLEYQKNLQEIRQLLREGVEIGAKGTIVIEETGVTYIHPCISEAGKVTAEARLTSGPEGAVDLKYGFYDPIQLCIILNMTGYFEDVRCSPNLGIGRVTVDNKTVLIYKDGRINVRRAKDREDAVQAIRLVSRTLWGAIICSCCGNAGVDCASGGCEDCITRVCPVIGGGPPDPNVTSPGPIQQTTASTIFDRVKALETKGYFEEGVKQLDEAFEIFGETSLNFLEKQVVDEAALKLIGEKIAQVNRSAIKFIVETLSVYDAAIGLILSGVAMDLTRMVNGLEIVVSSREALSPKLKEFFLEAVSIATDAYRDFRVVDFEKAKRIADRYTKFRKRWTEAFRKMLEKEVLAGIEKISVNGFYISRLLVKPLPT
ncbi:MAG: (Fe-S)-binding protein [Candidatus Bathyarchaeia archaeon]